ncbi:MAG: hypothetical protein NTZ09_14140, partial [Candidatus Hydrogenedentes bacterium]|nr:hypothetical protein [Candidatus Hydrogenedentota bacterium]
MWKSISADTGSAVWIDTPTSTSYDDFSLQGNVTYYYRIKASNGSQTSGFSVYDTGYRYQPMPNVPGNPSPSNGASNIPRSGQVLSWTGGGGVGIVQYALRIEANPNPGFYAGFGSITGTSWQIPFELEAGTVYYWGIRSRDEAGQIVDSPIWQFTAAYTYADLIPTALSISQGSIEPDAPITLSLTVRNQGTYPSNGGSYARFYLSRSAGAKEQQLYPLWTSVSQLQPGQEQTITCATTLVNLQAG